MRRSRIPATYLYITNIYNIYVYMRAIVIVYVRSLPCAPCAMHMLSVHDHSGPCRIEGFTLYTN